MTQISKLSRLTSFVYFTNLEIGLNFKGAIMYLDGNVEVLMRLFLKQRLQEKGSPEHQLIRPALLIGPGMMRGINGGGHVTSLHEFGLREVFEAGVFGISTGAPIGAFFLSGQARLGTRIYSQECATENFISGRRFWRGGHAVDTRYISEVFREKLDQQAIYRSPTPFYVGVTSAKTGEGRFLDAKSVRPDIVHAIFPSISFPGLSPGPTEIDGESWIDGTGALPLPLRRIATEHNPTDILVLANCPSDRRERKNHFESLLALWLFRHCSRNARRKFLSRNDEAKLDLVWLQEQSACRVAIIWSDRSIGNFEQNQERLQAAAAQAEKYLNTELLRAREIVTALTK